MNYISIFLLFLFVVAISCGLYVLYNSINMQMMNKNGSSFWATNIERETIENNNWRKVLHTTDNMQVVVMSVPVGQELGFEVHDDNDQLFRIEAGRGEIHTKNNGATLVHNVANGDLAVVGRGTWHNVINVAAEPLKLYTVYAPPHHKPGTIDMTHSDELAREN